MTFIDGCDGFSFYIILESWVFMQPEKLLLRSWAREQRKKFCSSLKRPELFKLHQLISQRVLDFFNFQPSDIIAGYWPKTNEVDPRPLLEALFLQKHEIVLPVINNKNKILLFRRWIQHTSLKMGFYKTLEPYDSQPSFEPNVLLIPLLSFDKHGHRLGYGGGYYDKTLSILKKRKAITTIGLAYDIQRIDQLPIESHDEALQWIVTEKNVYHLSEVV